MLIILFLVFRCYMVIKYRHHYFEGQHCSWLVNLNIPLCFNDCCDSLSKLVARELYWLLWLLQYEALNGYYGRICFKIATVDCINKIIGRNILKMWSI